MTRREQPSYTPEMHVESNDSQRIPRIEVEGVASLKEYAAQHPIIVVAGVWIDNLPYAIEGHKLLKVAQKDKVKKVIEKIPIPFNEWFIYPPTPIHQVDEYLKEQLYSEPVLGSLALRTDQGHCILNLTKRSFLSHDRN